MAEMSWTMGWSISQRSGHLKLRVMELIGNVSACSPSVAVTYLELPVSERNAIVDMLDFVETSEAGGRRPKPRELTHGTLNDSTRVRTRSRGKWMME
jgi:hypothetical protein